MKRRRKRSLLDKLKHTIDVLAFGKDYRQHPKQDSRKKRPDPARNSRKANGQFKEPSRSSRGRGVHIEDLPAAIQRQILGEK